MERWTWMWKWTQKQWRPATRPQPLMRFERNNSCACNGRGQAIL